MWTRPGPPALQRCCAPRRFVHVGLARERVGRTTASTQRTYATSSTYYDVLGVAATASSDEIKSAFRRQAKILHPDVSKSDDSEEEFKRLKEAYDTLSDARQRAQYDEVLRRRSARAAGGSGFSGSSGGLGGMGRQRQVIIMEDEFGGWTEVVIDGGFGVYGFDNSDDDSDDDDDDDDEGFTIEDLEFMAWAAAPNNMRASFQSSWQANARKARRGRQRAGAQQANAPLSLEDKELLLQELPSQARAAAQQVFGARLQSLKTLEELAEVLEAVQEMNAMGIEFEVEDGRSGRGFGGATRGSGSRRAGNGTGGRGRGGGGGGGGGGGAGTGRGRGSRPGGGSETRRRRT